MSVPREKITYQDYLQLPEEQRYEVLEGDLRMVPAPGILHQEALLSLSHILKVFLRNHRLGRVYIAPVDVILDEDSVVQPDLAVVLSERLDIVSPEGVRGAPDLVVEVLSPSTAHRDRGVKRRLYGRYGVQEYWLVDPVARTIEVACLRAGTLETVGVLDAGVALRSPLFPTLSFQVDELFTE